MEEKIKILYVISRLNIGGPTFHVLSLTQKFSNGSFESCLISGSPEVQEGHLSPQEQGIKHFFIPSLQRSLHPIKDMITFLKLLKLIFKIKPHIVHTHQAKAGLLGRLAGIVAGVPVRIHTFHGHVFHSYFSKWKTKAFIILERWLAKHSHLIAISPSQKKELEYFLKNPPSLTMLPLALPLKHLHEKTKTRTLRQELNIAQETVLIGIVGRIAPIKNHHFFLNVVEKISSLNSQVKFLIIGDGENRPEIKDKIKEKNLQKNIIILGWRNDLQNIYSSLDIVVLTSLNEGTPVSLIEALAAGKPVISTNVGGVSDIVQNHKNGFLIDHFDLDEFVSKLRVLIEDKILREKMGQSTQQEILNRYDEEKIREQMSDFYKNLIKNKTSSYIGAKHRGVGGEEYFTQI